MKNNEEKQSKICTKCNVEKELILFNNRKLPSGRVTQTSWCKSCHKTHKEKNRKTPRKIKLIKKTTNPNNKICYGCELEKPLNEFNKGKSRCKDCCHKEYEQNNQDRKRWKISSNPDNKICTKCNVEKALSEFNVSINPRRKYVPHSNCRDCEKIRYHANKPTPKIKQIKITKICNNCNVEKSINDFYITKGKGNRNDQIRPKCKDCENMLNKKWRDENPGKIKAWGLAWRKRNVETVFNITSKFCSGCKLEKPTAAFDKTLGNMFNLSRLCKECKSPIRKETHNKNKAYYNAYSREYARNNKSRLNSNNLKRIKANPILKLRQAISSKIYYMLKTNGGSKNGNSIFDHLPYTLMELKQHIESQWVGEKAWMNWDNYGKYYFGGPRRWHLDHINPKSALPFDSMEHPNFLKCWGLDNLQPLDAVENMQKHNKINFYKNKEEINCELNDFVIEDEDAA